MSDAIDREIARLNAETDAQWVRFFDLPNGAALCGMIPRSTESESDPDADWVRVTRPTLVLLDPRHFAPSADVVPLQLQKET